MCLKLIFKDSITFVDYSINSIVIKNDDGKSTRIKTQMHAKCNFSSIVACVMSGHIDGAATNLFRLAIFLLDFPLSLSAPDEDMSSSEVPKFRFLSDF